MLEEQRKSKRKFVSARRRNQHARRMRYPISAARKSCPSARSPIVSLVTMTSETDRPSDFIRDIVAEDVRAGKYERIQTRFPPEPNGYLHIGHAKSICLNFGIAREFGGICNVRMDDTNPTKEETEYVNSIMADVHWLINGWADKNIGGAPLYASDYFDKFYEYASGSCPQGQGVCGRHVARSKQTNIGGLERKVPFATDRSRRISICWAA